MNKKIDLFLEKYMDKELKESGDINSKYINYMSDYSKYKNNKIIEDYSAKICCYKIGRGDLT